MMLEKKPEAARFGSPGAAGGSSPQADADAVDEPAAAVVGEQEFRDCLLCSRGGRRTLLVPD